MSPVLLLVAGVLLFALATWAHYSFWTRHYFVPTGEDEQIYAHTADGWRLALGRRRPRGPRRGEPVLLVHGLAANRGSLDFGVERWSVSAHLAAVGFDCFALDLRGHGASSIHERDTPRTWTFDDYVRLDVPAALDAIRAATGHDRVLWVGHSQGGLLGIAACGLYPDRIAGLVAIGSPVFFRSQQAIPRVVTLAFVLVSRLNRFLARILVPYSGYWHPPVSEVAINTRNVTRPVFRRVLVNVVENVSRGVILQFTRWIATDTFASVDGRIDYRAAMARCRQPALFLAAAADQLAPPADVARAAKLWGGESEFQVVGLATSACCDYGHSDLLFGPRAPEEVFTRISRWLVAHAHRAETVS